jgi:hypothetical protein
LRGVFLPAKRKSLPTSKIDAWDGWGTKTWKRFSKVPKNLLESERNTGVAQEGGLRGIVAVNGPACEKKQLREVRQSRPRIGHVLAAPQTTA